VGFQLALLGPWPFKVRLGNLAPKFRGNVAQAHEWEKMDPGHVEFTIPCSFHEEFFVIVGWDTVCSANVIFSAY